MNTTATPDNAGVENGRPLRKDAARNRMLLLEAAHAVFAERGLEASLDDVAHVAGVGVGTAYRHFANKQELAEALFAKHIDEILDEAEKALAIEDPWAAIVTFFWSAAERQAIDMGLHQMLVGQYSATHRVDMRERLSGPIAVLFERAKTVGVLREGVEPTDAGVVFCLMGTVFTMGAATDTELWRRYLTILLDGLRASTSGPLPSQALSYNELDKAIAAVKKH